MKLKFIEQYYSIKELNDIDIPEEEMERFLEEQEEVELT